MIKDISLDRIANGANQHEVFELEQPIHAEYVDAMRKLDIQPGQRQGAAGECAREADMLKVPQLNIAPFDGTIDGTESRNGNRFANRSSMGFTHE